MKDKILPIISASILGLYCVINLLFVIIWAITSKMPFENATCTTNGVSRACSAQTNEMMRNLFSIFSLGFLIVLIITIAAITLNIIGLKKHHIKRNNFYLAAGILSLFTGSWISTVLLLIQYFKGPKTIDQNDIYYQPN